MIKVAVYIRCKLLKVNSNGESEVFHDQLVCVKTAQSLASGKVFDYVSYTCY